MRIDVATLFPAWFAPLLESSVLARAVASGLVSFRAHDLRDHTTDRHRKVDDAPYGGGAGMVMKAEPFYRLHDELMGDGLGRPHVVLMTPRGRPFDQERAKELAAQERLVFFCGHYKGVDGRVDEIVDEELSLGDFVLSGGEYAAIAMIDAVVRLIPGAVSDYDSVETDSLHEGLLACPEYTRPEVFRGMGVPEVLLSGHHARIEAWRRERSLALTRERRPDLADAWEREHEARRSSGRN